MSTKTRVTVVTTGYWVGRASNLFKYLLEMFHRTFCKSLKVECKESVVGAEYFLSWLNAWQRDLWYCIKVVRVINDF